MPEFYWAKKVDLYANKQEIESQEKNKCVEQWKVRNILQILLDITAVQYTHTHTYN